MRHARVVARRADLIIDRVQESLYMIFLILDRYGHYHRSGSAGCRLGADGPM